METTVQPKIVNRAATVAPAAAAKLAPRPAAAVIRPAQARRPLPVSNPLAPPGPAPTPLIGEPRTLRPVSPPPPVQAVGANLPPPSLRRQSRLAIPFKQSKPGIKDKAPTRPDAAAGPRTEAQTGAVAGKTGKRKTAATPSPRPAIAPAISAIRERASRARRHPDPGVPVASAENAAIVPAMEQTRDAARQTIANLDEAKANEIKRQEFKDKLKEAIEKATPQPKTESQADKVMKTGAADASKTMRQQLSTERDAAAGPLKSAAKTEALPSDQPKPPETRLQLEQVGPAPQAVSAAPVVPAPLPPEQLDYSSDRAPTDQMMAENNVNQEQLKKGNEPAFGPTLEARSTAEKHEASVAPQYRQSEAKVQVQAQVKAATAIVQGLTGMHGTRTGQVGQVVGQQHNTKKKNEVERQRITDKITEIKNNTRTAVNTILDEMESGAAEIFETGLKNAEKVYEATFEEAKGGAWTWLTTWGSDWEELIENSLATARQAYLNQVDVAIDQVANFVSLKLVQAKKRVATGLSEVETFVQGLDKSVKKFGVDALKLVKADFEAMDSEIDQRRDGLIDKLAQQYKDSYERMSAMEEKLREANKSLWQRVYDATVGLIKKILAFKDMLLSILVGAVSLILDIISDPIGFLGNLVSAVRQGLEKFMSNIEVHLQKGLMDWLFGAIAASGLQLPDKFDLQGIVSIVLQILGLTYARFRARAVALVGEPVVAALEQAAEVFKVIITEGILGLWRFIKDQVTDLKSLVLDAIFSFIKDRVIMAGITWIIGLLNPASAFFKACKAIYDIVVFFINRGSQIIALVNAVIDSIKAIAKGALGAAVVLVEGALAKTIPVAIGFLASLLGLGDPSKPVRETIEKARSPINKAIDWVINLAVKAVKATGKFIGGLLGKKDKEKKAPGPEETPRDIYGLTQQALLSRLGPEASVAEGREAASQVLMELGPSGLRHLEVRWSDTTKSYVFDAAASPGKEIIWLAPSNKKVLMYSKIVFEGSPLQDIEERFLAESRETLAITGGQRVARPTPPISPRLAAKDPRGHRKQALVVVEPAPASSVLETASWNAGGPVEGSAVSHAEAQFVDWATSTQRGPTWRIRIKEVDIHISHSPCDHCAPTLEFLANMLPNATKLQIRWDELYVDPKGQRSTSSAGLNRLKKWILIGPKPAGVAAPTVQKRVKSKP
jgi:hypothetical protein